MHMLLIEGTFKPGTKNEFLNLWASQILPTLKKQPGYIDEILLYSEQPQQGVGLSFWKSQKEADHYQSEVFPQQAAKVKHLLNGTPTIRNFNVEASETFRIATKVA
jgi:heme-degrading monooxygenase HmoA